MDRSQCRGTHTSVRARLLSGEDTTPLPTKVNGSRGSEWPGVRGRGRRTRAVSVTRYEEQRRKCRGSRYSRKKITLHKIHVYSKNLLGKSGKLNKYLYSGRPSQTQTEKCERGVSCKRNCRACKRSARQEQGGQVPPTCTDEPCWPRLPPVPAAQGLESFSTPGISQSCRWWRVAKHARENEE